MNDHGKYTAIEIIKFMCVAVMIFVHAHIVLITDGYAISDTSGFFYRITSDLMFLCLFIMILPILAGIVYGINKNFDIKKTLKSGLFLVLLGFLMNAFTWSIFYIFSWNILQFIALSFFVLAILIKFFSTKFIFLVGLLSIIIAEPLRNILSDLSNNYLIGIFIGADNHYMFWPFFPWFGLVAFGFVFIRIYEKYKNEYMFNLLSGVLGLILILPAIIKNEISPFLDPVYIWGPSLFQPQTLLVVAALGAFLCLITISNFLFKDIELSKYGIINSYSKGILWIYVIQMFVSFKLSFVIKEYFSMEGPSLAYFILPIFMLIFSWIIGALGIKLFTERIVIKIKK